MSNFNTAEQSNQEISQDSLELNDEELDAVAGGCHEVRKPKYPTKPCPPQNKPRKPVCCH